MDTCVCAGRSAWILTTNNNNIYSALARENRVTKGFGQPKPHSALCVCVCGLSKLCRCFSTLLCMHLEWRWSEYVQYYKQVLSMHTGYNDKTNSSGQLDAILCFASFFLPAPHPRLATPTFRPDAAVMYAMRKTGYTYSKTAYSYLHRIRTIPKNNVYYHSNIIHLSSDMVGKLFITLWANVVVICCRTMRKFIRA